MAAPNRTCVVCGERYYYCSSTSCSESFYKPNWMIMFHDENCKNIFTIISEHYHKRLTDEEAIKQLEQCDLSKIDDFNFSEDVRKDLDNVLSKRKQIEPKTQINYKNYKDK